MFKVLIVCMCSFVSVVFGVFLCVVCVGLWVWCCVVVTCGVACLFSVLMCCCNVVFYVLCVCL